MVSFIPYKQCVFKSYLTLEELQQRILDNTLSVQEYMQEQDKRLFTSGSQPWSKKYMGKVYRSGFEIERLLNYRNPSNPLIVGELNPGDEGTEVRIKMKLDAFGGFVLLCFVLTAGVFLYILYTQLTKGVFYSTLLISAGICLFAYLLLIVPFNMEAIKSQKFLANLFATGIRKTAANTQF